MGRFNFHEEPAEQEKPQPQPEPKPEAPVSPPLAAPPASPEPVAKPPTRQARAAKPGKAPANRSVGGAATLALALFTAAYCAAELAYNLSLIEFLSSPNTSVDAFDGLERVGKALAAIGLALFFARQARGRKALAVFAALAPCAYLMIGWGFDAAIASLPVEAKRAGYYMGAYRNLVLNQRVSDKALLPDGAPDIHAKLALANMPLMSAGTADIQGTVISWVYGDPAKRGGADAQAMSALWKAYSEVDRKIGPYYAVYAIQSKINAERPMFKEKYTEAFMKRSGGIPPGLDKAAFYAAVSQKSPALARFQQAVVIPGRPELNLPELKVADIPPFLTEAQFMAFMSEKIDAAKNAARNKADDVESLKDSKKIISAAYVPPMSMTLSLLSLTLNLALLMVSAIQLVGWGAPALRERRAVKVSLSVAAVCLAGAFVLSRPPALAGQAGEWQRAIAARSIVGAAWSKGINAEGALLAAAEPLLRGIHAAFINDDPNGQIKRVAIEKVEEADLGHLDASIEALKSEPSDLPAADTSIKIDEARMNDKGYYGELKNDRNPYLKK